MAVDTASKRYSMINMGDAVISPLFIPDSTIDDGDKYHLLNLYFGIALDEATASILKTFGINSKMHNTKGMTSKLHSTRGAESNMDSTKGFNSHMDSTKGYDSE